MLMVADEVLYHKQQRDGQEVYQLILPKENSIRRITWQCGTLRWWKDIEPCQRLFLLAEDGKRCRDSC